MLLSKKLRRLSTLYIKAIAKDLPEPHTEYLAELLIVLSSRNIPISQKELATYMHIDKSRIAMMIEQLNNLHYVYIEKNAADRRKHCIFLTNRGKKLVPGIQRTIAKVNEIIEHGINPAHLEQFYATLLQMEQNVLKHVGQ